MWCVSQLRLLKSSCSPTNDFLQRAHLPSCLLMREISFIVMTLLFSCVKDLFSKYSSFSWTKGFISERILTWRMILTSGAFRRVLVFILPLGSLYSHEKTQLRFPILFQYLFFTHLADLFGCRRVAHAHSLVQIALSTSEKVVLEHWLR